MYQQVHVVNETYFSFSKLHFFITFYFIPKMINILQRHVKIGAYHYIWVIKQSIYLRFTELM